MDALCPGKIWPCMPSHQSPSWAKEVAGLPMQRNNPDCPRVAQHALVLGLGGNVQPDALVSAQTAQPFHSAV